MKTKALSEREILRICREFGRRMHEDVVAIAAEAGISREEVEAKFAQLKVAIH